MKFLADENVPWPAVSAREHGFEVAWLTTGLIVRLIGITERDRRDRLVGLNDCDQLAGHVWAWEAAMAGSVLTDDWHKIDRGLLGGPGWPRR
jgi:hypothetical protein